MRLKGFQLRIPIKRIALAILLVALAGGLVLRSQAQSGESPWTTPVNLSQSGSASQPVIAAAPDSTLHALWWDQFDGEQYAYTTDITGTSWSSPIAVPQIIGDRKVNEQTGEVTLTAPRDVRMLSDAQGNVHAFWYDVKSQLLDVQTQGMGWSGPTTLAEAALALDAAADLSGTLRLAYVRPLSGYGFPAGVYYRATTGFGWSAPSLVYASPYFRTIKPEDAHVSVAGNGQGQALAAWDEPRLGKSFYARSADDGLTWSQPHIVSGTHALVAAAPNGEFLLLWQDANAGGCGLSQGRSSNGGQTWSAPERVLTSLTRCPARWQFAPGRGRLWLIGTSPSDESASGAATLAAWDGAAWSEPAEVNLSFRDPATDRTAGLGCLSVTVSGANVGLAGCDASGDVWAARNAVTLDNLAQVLKPVWSTPQILSDGTGQAGIPALAANNSGKLYAMWSQSTAEGQPGTALYAAAWDGNRWSRAAQALQSPNTSTGILPTTQTASKAEQPALAADVHDRLHAVWSGGASGEIYYSWAYARDATSAQGWAEPVMLPGPTLVGSWPDILADPRGDVLHVVYAVPYNEKRGIYAVRSNDGGQTWLTPTVVFDAVAAGWDSADKPRLALDAKTNTLHAVWLHAALPGSTELQAVYYARSTDGGQTWSQPLKVAEGVVDWPRVAVGSAGQVHLVWSQARTRSGSASPYSAEMWHQFSLDGGERWSEPARVRGFEQMSGPASLVSDGANGLYLMGAGQGNSGEAALLYTQWTGSAWSERETLGLGQDTASGNAAAAAIPAESGQLGVALREFARGQDGTSSFGIAATGREIPNVPITPAPTFTPLPTGTPTPTSTPQPTATVRPQLNATGTPQPVETGPLKGQEPLMLGGALAAAIVLIAVVGRLIWGSRR